MQSVSHPARYACLPFQLLVLVWATSDCSFVISNGEKHEITGVSQPAKVRFRTALMPGSFGLRLSLTSKMTQVLHIEANWQLSSGMEAVKQPPLPPSRRTLQRNVIIQVWHAFMWDFLLFSVLQEEAFGGFGTVEQKNAQSPLITPSGKVACSYVSSGPYICLYFWCSDEHDEHDMYIHMLLLFIIFYRCISTFDCFF